MVEAGLPQVLRAPRLLGPVAAVAVPRVVLVAQVPREAATVQTTTRQQPTRPQIVARVVAVVVTLALLAALAGMADPEL